MRFVSVMVKYKQRRCIPSIDERNLKEEMKRVKDRERRHLSKILYDGNLIFTLRK